MIIKNDPDTIKSYLEDSSGIRGGHADKAFLPESAEEAAALLNELN